jgi:hypothetical protein
MGTIITKPGGGGGATTSFNVFEYTIKTSSTVPTPLAGDCYIYISGGEIIRVYISKTTADALNITNYLTSRLDNSSIMINVSTLSPQDSIIILTESADFGSYLRFGAEPYGLGYDWGAGLGDGTGTVTFIP